jgi:signal peptidase
MTPTIPTGSLAVVEKIPASEIHIGDVVTVDRGTLLPITHRVISIKDGSADAAGSRQIRMKGDANPVADPEPYVVTTVRRVIFSVPGLAYPLVTISNPLVMGGITLGAAGLITWTFWPGGRAKTADDVREDSSAKERGRRGRKGRRRATHQPVRTPMIIPFLLVPVAVVIAVAHPSAAIADVTEHTITGRYLTLISIADEDAMANLTPGAPATWQVGISAHPPEPGDVMIAISAVGPKPMLDEFMLAVTSCTVRWVDDRCPGTSSTWLSEQSIDAATEQASITRSVATFPSNEQRWARVSVTLARRISPGTAVSLVIHASGAESTISADNTGDGTTSSVGASESSRASLAFTGASSSLTMAIIGGLLVVQGGILATVMVLGSRRRSAKDDR